MVTLFCAVVGVAGSAFPVDVDDEQSVGHMKDAINDKKKYRFPADELQLFLAKTKRGGWLPDDDPAALKVKVGAIYPDIQTMIDVEQLGATWEIQDVLAVNKMTEQHGRTPTSRQIHVLVVVPLEWHDPAAKYSLLEEEVVPRGTGGSPLLQLADQDVLWYGMKGSVGRGEGIDLETNERFFGARLPRTSSTDLKRRTLC